MHRESLSGSPGLLLVGTANLKGTGQREKIGPESIRLFGRRMRAQIRRCPALFAENPDYVPLPLALFGAIASFSSERNAVSKSSALTMNRFPSRVCGRTEWVYREGVRQVTKLLLGSACEEMIGLLY